MFPQLHGSGPSQIKMRETSLKLYTPPSPPPPPKFLHCCTHNGLPYYHLHLGLPGGLLPFKLSAKNSYANLMLPCVSSITPSYPPFEQLSNFRWRKQITKPFIMWCPLSCYLISPSLLDSNIPLSTLFSNAPNLHSSLGVNKIFTRYETLNYAIEGTNYFHD